MKSIKSALSKFDTDPLPAGGRKPTLPPCQALLAPYGPFPLTDALLSFSMYDPSNSQDGDILSWDRSTGSSICSGLTILENVP
jgi:hypothetical protein